jgi:hypothetical protein
MKSWAKGITNKVMGRTTRSSSRYDSSRARSDMSIDPPAVQPASSSAAPQRILLTTTHLALRDLREKNIYNKLKNRNFIHTLVLDEVFLCKTGMATELDTIFQFVGWSSFATIAELGSKLLTIEFLCTLQFT